MKLPGGADALVLPGRGDYVLVLSTQFDSTTANPIPLRFTAGFIESIETAAVPDFRLGGEFTAAGQERVITFTVPEASAAERTLAM